jgi:hypothetical protein
MWIIRRNAVTDEQQGSIPQLENRFSSGAMEYVILINKSKEFSQSLSKVPAGGDIIWQKPIITRVVIKNNWKKLRFNKTVISKKNFPKLLIGS